MLKSTPMSQPNPFEGLKDVEIEKAFEPLLADSGVREAAKPDELLDPEDVDRVVERTGKKLSAERLRKDRQRAIQAEDKPAGITVGKDAIAGNRPLTIREYAIGFVRMHHAKRDLREALNQKLDAVVTAFQFSEDEKQRFVEAVERIHTIQEERDSALRFLRGAREQTKKEGNLNEEVVVARLIDDFQVAVDSPSVTADAIFSDMAVDPDYEDLIKSTHTRWLESRKEADSVDVAA